MSLILSGDGSITGLTSSGVAGSSVNYLPAGTGAVATTVQSKLRETVSVKDFGADPTGVADSTSAINAAVTALPSAGGTVLFPDSSAYYKITGPILDAGKRVRFVLSSGATIKPSVDTDVFRLTGLGSSIEGYGTIDGSLVASGSGNGVVVGYGGANSAETKIECQIQYMRGAGILWDQGAFLTTRVLINNCYGDGILCTANYDDNNHGNFIAHIVNCAGVGFRTIYNASVNLRSRSHVFVDLKTFGCAGGILIETEQNSGNLFAELNTGYQIKLDTNAWGNVLTCLGANGIVDFTEVTPRTNILLGAQGGGYNYAAATTLLSNYFKLRDKVNVGGISLAMTGANAAQLLNTDATADFTLTFANNNAPTNRFITTVDKLKWTQGSGTIDYMASAQVSLAFGTVGANSSSAVSTGVSPGVGVSVFFTWADTAANLPNGISLVPSIDRTSGTLYCVAVNATTGAIAVGTGSVRYVIMRHS